jgi:hypothetical protein
MKQARHSVSGPAVRNKHEEDKYKPLEQWPDYVQDNDYEPPESFAVTDNEIIDISDKNKSEGNHDKHIQHISAAEVIPEVHATQPKAEPIRTFKNNHTNPRQRRVIFLRFNHICVVILQLTNTTMSNTSPTLSADVQGSRGSVNWLQVEKIAQTALANIRYSAAHIASRPTTPIGDL